MNFISRNLERDLPLIEVARSASFSEYHFHRIFKAVTGETVGGFTRRLRLESAANHLVSNSSDDITTIALKYGFSSSQNFARAFRRQFGRSPSAYQKSKKRHKQSNHSAAFNPNLSYHPEELSGTRVPEGKILDISVRDLPKMRVAYARKIGPSGKETFEAALLELVRWAGPTGNLCRGGIIGVFWDNPEITPDNKCRIDACVRISGSEDPVDRLATQVIAGGLYAVHHVETVEAGVVPAWEDAFVWVVNRGYELRNKPCYQVYHNHAQDHPENKWILDICLPLKS